MIQKSSSEEATRSKSTEENTQTRILQAALRLFARQGYDATTTKDLAIAAGVALHFFGMTANTS